MAGFRISGFGGIIPLLNPRKLPDRAAQRALDCDLEGTDLRPLTARVLMGVVADSNNVQRSAFVFRPDQMFIWNADVNATYGPIQHEDEANNKVYIGSGWFDYPVWTTRTLGIPASPEAAYYGPPINHRKLGVAAPEVPPLLSVDPLAFGNITGVEGNDITLEDGVTVATDAVIMSCSGPHELKTGDRVRLEGFDWEQLNNSFIIDLIWDNLPNFETRFVLRNVSYTALYEAADTDTFPTPGTGTWTQDFSDSDLEDRVYLFTYVSAEGEEGPPSLPTESVTVGPGQGVTISTPTAGEVDGFLVAFKRIYRTLPTSRGSADYYFVAETPVTQGEYYDTLEPIELGERMPSLEWVQPPEGLTGLTTLPNGVVAGFKGNALYLSEPYQPHAWPESYIKWMEHPIVGIAAFGTSLVIGTDDKPYIGTATDPLSMTFTMMETVEPCLAKRACKSLGYGVMYPSPNGLILVTPRGTKNVLKGLWQEEDWRDKILNADEVFAEVHDESYYLTITTGGSNITYAFDPSQEPLMITELTGYNYTGCMVDRDEDRMFFLGQSAGPRVYEFDPDNGSFTNTDWISRTFVMPQPVNMGAAQVFFDTDESGSITLEFYADKVLKFTKSVTDQEPFRLPSGFIAREWYVRVIANRSVQEIYVSETIDELVGAFSR